MPTPTASWKTNDGRLFETEREALYREAELAEVLAFNAMARAKTELLKVLDKYARFDGPGHACWASYGKDKNPVTIEQAAAEFGAAQAAHAAARELEFSRGNQRTKGPSMYPDTDTERKRYEWPEHRARERE